jgi:hypothetical protein
MGAVSAGFVYFSLSSLFFNVFQLQLFIMFVIMLSREIKPLEAKIKKKQDRYGPVSRLL